MQIRAAWSELPGALRNNCLTEMLTFQAWNSKYEHGSEMASFLCAATAVQSYSRPEMPGRMLLLNSVEHCVIGFAKYIMLQVLM